MSQTPHNIKLSKELKDSLSLAFQKARDARYEFITIEYLLLCLLENSKVISILRACAADIKILRDKLTFYVEKNNKKLPENDAVVSKPSLDFERIIQRAIMHVTSTGDSKRKVGSGQVLIAFFGEKSSYAVHYLHQQGVTRLEVTYFFTKGVKKIDTIPKACLRAKEKLLKELAGMDKRKVIRFSMPTKDAFMFFKEVGLENFEHLKALKIGE